MQHIGEFDNILSSPSEVLDKSNIDTSMTRKQMRVDQLITSMPQSMIDNPYKDQLDSKSP